MMSAISGTGKDTVGFNKAENTPLFSERYRRGYRCFVMSKIQGGRRISTRLSGENMENDTYRGLDSGQLMEQYEKLRETAAKDSLTGLLNRGTAENYIKRKLNMMNSEDSCALFIVDLDKFKQVNDTFGHMTGDQVLRQAAQILSGLFRASDIVGRLGGDEFVIFLAGFVNEEILYRKGGAICENLQLTLEEGLTVTASVGICLSRGGSRSFERLYNLADAALYESKRGGRRRYLVKLDTHEQGFEEVKEISANTVKLTQILEYMDSGVALFEPQLPLHAIYISPGLKRMLGIGEGKLPEFLLDRIIHPEDMYVFERMMKKVQEGIEVSQTVRVLKRQGDYMWCRMRMAKVDYEMNKPAIMFALTDISELKKEEMLLKNKNEKLQAAFEQAGQGIWEVDISTGMFHMLGNDDYFEMEDQDWIEFPEGLVRNGYIHQDSAVMLREFAKSMFEGKEKGYGNFLLKEKNIDSYEWASFSYNLLFDDSGRTIRAVGIVERFSNKESGMMTFETQKRTIPKMLLPYMVFGTRANLNKNEILEAWLEGKNVTGASEWKSYDQLMQRTDERFFCREDAKEFRQKFNRKALLKAYEKKEYWITLEYRRIDSGGEVQWVMNVVNVYRDTDSGDIHMFGCLRTVEKKRKWERGLIRKAVRDPVTKLYDRHTARDVALSQIKQYPEQLCGMVLIQISGLHKLLTGADEEDDRIRFFIATAFYIALEPICILGQYQRDKILVFFPDMSSEEHVRKIIEEAFVYVRTVLSGTIDMEKLRFVGGAICSLPRETDYHKMLKAVVLLCDEWWQSKYDKVIFPQDSEDWRWREIKRAAGDDRTCSPLKEMERPLSEEEKDVMLKCLSSMLISESSEYYMQTVLSSLGEYYKSDRAYILRVAEDKNAVSMIHEWTSSGKHSIKKTISGLQLERFPILQRCIKEKAPIFLTRELERGLSHRAPWKYMIFPMIEGSKLEYFLCIENPSERETEAALPANLLPFLIKGKQKNSRLKQVEFAGGGKSEKGLQDDLPNLRSYMEVIYGFSSETYSCLGAVCVDIPELPALNSSYGFEFGSRLLWYVARILGNIFGNSLLFRTWEAEFVVLSPDITKESFSRQCERLKSAINSRYPGKVRIGHTWSEGVFFGKTLVEEARSIMSCEKINKLKTPYEEFRGNRDEGGIVHARKCTVYFQPKLDFRTGEIVGAEALVRGIDDSGSIILPARFLDDMERFGTIRDLDLHVLDQSLRALEIWRSQGLSIVPISVNFSKKTLLDSTVLASVLAIQSRYPNIPQDMIEIEIADSAASINHTTLKELIDSFREFGIRFALDDFGSRYSNLSVFTNIKFDTVKLDRSLIMDLTRNKMCRMLVRDIVRMCQAAGMECVAVGLETREQLAILKSSGCQCAQGYYFDKPLSANEFRIKYLYKVNNYERGDASNDE